MTPLNPTDKNDKRVAKFGSDTPMKRPAQPEEIAPAFVFLAAPSCSSYITGEVLPIIGAAAHKDVDMGMLGVPMVDGDPVEPGAQIARGLIHEFAREAA